MFASKNFSLTAPSNNPLGAYTVARSLRFRNSASAYLNRTPGSSGNRNTFTYSFWIKWTGSGGGEVFAVTSGSGTAPTQEDNRLDLNLSSSGSFTFYELTSGSIVCRKTTSQVFRDPGSWYHFVVAIDYTQAVADNRIKMYVNGSQITTFSTNTSPSLNQTSYMNGAGNAHYIGGVLKQFNAFSDQYLSEFYVIDGQALTPSSFGAYNQYGVWQPIKYTGTYGTNGFYLKFNSYATTAALGTDSSGNNNTWTVNNMSVTAGATYDSMTDVSTLTNASAANYATLNPLIRQYSSVDFASDCNLKYTVGSNGGATDTIIATIAMVSGKWYAEVYINAAVTSQWVGVSSNVIAEGLGTFAAGVRNPGYAYKVNTGNKCNNDNTGTAYAASSTTGDTIGIAMDADSGSITFYKNGTNLGVAFTGMTNSGNGWAFGCDSDPNGSFFWNFGQQGFKYIPPTGYTALNTFNLSQPTIPNGAKYMSATTYTGNGSTQTIINSVNGASFQPDLVWVKKRSAAAAHGLIDSVRGAGIALASNLTDAERNNGTGSGGDVIAFNSNGFNLGNNTTGSATDSNLSGATYVGWQWKAGGSSVSNTNGSITSTVSANTTAGFSIVTYTGTGANATVGHGLGVAPSMIIVKCRDTAATPWAVYHSALANTQYLYLNSTAAVATGINLWNSTTPSSTVFTIGSAQDTNYSTKTFVAYCFAPVTGYSAFGSYTGNGSTDGPFVYTGFRPRWVMLKRVTDGAQGWQMYDNSRNPYNTETNLLFADGANAEQAGNAVDILSNGFKLRSSDTPTNSSSIVYIYMAFAENPFKYALAR